MFYSIIHTCVKDEEFILNEWILYHLILGFEHIYIFDDNSNIPVESVISTLPCIYSEKVTVKRLDIDFFNEDLMKTSSYYDENMYKEFESRKQLYLLNFFLRCYKDTSKWCLFCDVDEFVVLRDEQSVNHFLQKYENSYNTLYIPWLCYGSSYYINQPNGLIVDNFIRHSNQYHYQGKSFCKLSCIHRISDVHSIIDEVDYTNLSVQPFDYKKSIGQLPIHINHYVITSIRKFLSRKLLRFRLGGEGAVFYSMDTIVKSIFLHNDILTDRESTSSQFQITCARVGNILKLNLDIQLSTMVVDDTICFYALKSSDCLLHFESKNISLEILKQFLCDKNLRFIKWDEIIPTNFNVLTYKKINSDITNMSDSCAKFHFFLHGKREKRKFEYEELVKYHFSSIKNTKFEYGCDELLVDVTSIITSMTKNKTLQIIDTKYNDIFGDPVEGTIKYLKVTEGTHLEYINEDRNLQILFQF